MVERGNSCERESKDWDWNVDSERDDVAGNNLRFPWGEFSYC